MEIAFTSNFRKKQNRLRQLKVRTEIEGLVILNRTGDAFIEHTSRIAPHRTGDLADSIGNPSKGGIYERFAEGRGLRIGTTVGYARAVNEGIRRPYPIAPKNAKVLKFIGKDGETVYRHSVVHPPMSGKFFMNRGLIFARRDLPQIIRSVKKMGSRHA